VSWAAYSDPEVLARERREIFERSWHYAGHAGEVARPGDFAATFVGHLPVVLVRGEDGELRAFLNVCRHRGHEVAAGSGNRRTLQCPYHAWTYDLDGSLRSAPRSDREPGFDPSGLALVPLRVEILGPLVFVNPEPGAAPLTDFLGPVPGELGDLADLVFHRRIAYEVEANWKIVMENYLECYHCPVAHPGFSREVDVDPDSYVLEAGEWSSSQYARARNGDGQGQFHYVWPATRLNVFPGVPNLSVGAAVPVSPMRTRGFFDYFFGRAVSEAEIEELIAFDAQVGSEDRALVESVQRGVATGLLTEGRLLPESEKLIAHFQALVQSYV
jgi:phenylpropionate dioxygenase-like ring-hydroxylating dioxygenase large terminal subunit